MAVKPGNVTFEAPPDKVRRLRELQQQLATRTAAADDRPTAWPTQARPEQLPPATDWLVWAFLAGRGAGKTRAAAEWVTEQARTPGLRIALVGRTPADVRDVMIEGDSGLLAVAPPNRRPTYEPTKRRLTWPNGTQAAAYSAEVPSALRGPQHHLAWCDEASSWSDAHKGDSVDTAWNNLMLGLRLGDDPRCAVTTTPKPNLLTKTILARSSTAVTRGTTYDNLTNLAPSFRQHVLDTYEGTRIGRQELLGELLEDVVGALWDLTSLDTHRIQAAPDLVRVVIGFDPAVTSGEDADTSGIVCVGVAADGHLYVLGDHSVKATPDGCARRIAELYEMYRADAVVVEVNNGGDYLPDALRRAHPSMAVRTVRASRGKHVRAQPVSMLYEQGRVHHVGTHSHLEDQLTSWTPDAPTSPDRLDALVWAVTELVESTTSAAVWIDYYRRKTG